VDYLEVDEVQAMLHAVFQKGAGYTKFKRYRNRAIIALMFSAGLRNGELCAMERTQIKPGIDSFTVIGKGNKPRVCFIDPVTHKYIDEYLALRDDPYPALFVSEQQKGQEKINPGVVQMVVKNAAIKAGLEKNIHPHTLRHSFATDLLRNNTNIVYVKELLGHASIQVTMTYTHVVNEDLREIHRRKHTVIHA
ncbi:tyrosine-type recombinase/integrase, partial [Candidatus Saccharibacteria bacterium]|nr:tyrosine-type recombinase/integrase [Candidatus Saccharibacteria bacterium]